MNMIFHPVNTIQNTSSFGYYSPDILIKRFLLIKRDGVFPVVGAKHNVIKYLSIAVHNLKVSGKPSQGFRVCTVTFNPRFAPGLFTENSYRVLTYINSLGVAGNFDVKQRHVGCRRQF